MTSFTCDDLHNKNSLKRFLRSFDINLRKNLGQHFLFDRTVLNTIAESSGGGRIVVEVGAGLGSLTCLLKRSFDRVYGIEVDDRFEDPFNEVNPEENVVFLKGNVLDIDLSEIVVEKKERAGIVGNIPYNITGKILKKLVSEREIFSRAVLTIQKEVSDRILARPGTRGCGPITYLVQAYGEVNHVLDVPPEAFYPPPDVNSSTVKITLAEKSKFDCDEETFFSLIRGTFIHRRKTVRNGLISSPEFSLSKEDVDSLLESAEIDSRKRPEELSVKDYDRLGKEFSKRRYG
ncbi:MAG: 16S rRNA (adenine(1518)-N(6)/adenine(1519)-N(6))-dimethyltransferase RsmA [Candidatus Bipolaricaulota bacterium]